MSLERRREAWSSYWASGNIDSCVGGLVERHDGAIRNFWSRAVAGLAPGARILDIATGNGSLPRLLLEILQKDVCIDAVDMAALRPQWMHETAKHETAKDALQFHPGVAMEDLPFAPQTFDLVVSQFGIEYGKWPIALEEVARVCARSGTVAFIMHHVDSLVVRLGRIEAAHQQYLLADNGLLSAADALLPHMARVMAGGQPDQQANVCRHAYNQAMSELASRLESEVPDLLIQARQQVHAIMAGVRGSDLSTLAGYLGDYRRMLQDAFVRTSELLDCALNRAQLEEAIALLESCLPGRKLTAAPLLQGRDVLAWGVLAVPE